MRRRQHRGQRHFDRLHKRRFLRAHFVEERHLRIHLRRLHGAPIRPRHEPRHHLPRVRLLVLVLAWRIKQQPRVTRRRPHRMHRPLQLDPVDHQLRPRELILPLHPEILEHLWDVVCVVELQSRFRRRKECAHFVSLRRGLRRIDIQLRELARRPAEMLRYCHARRTVVIHPMRGKMLHPASERIIRVFRTFRILRQLIIAPLAEDRLCRLHHSRPIWHTPRRAKPHDILAIRRNLEIAEPNAFVPRLVMHHGESALRRVLPVVQDDIIRAPLHAIAVAAECIFLRLKAPLDRLRLGALHQRTVQDLPRRRVVKLHLHRRNRQRLPDIIKAPCRRVLREFFRRLKVHTHQIADRIIVLPAIHPAQHHTRRALCNLRLRQFLLQPFHKPGGSLGCRLLFILRRHLVTVYGIYHLLPLPRDRRVRKIIRQRIQPQLPLLLLRPMTRRAVFLNKRLHHLRKARRILRRKTPRRKNNSQPQETDDRR